MVEGALSVTEKIHSRLNGVEVATAFGGPPLIANQEAVPPRDVIEVDRWLKLYIYGYLRQPDRGSVRSNRHFAAYHAMEPTVGQDDPQDRTCP